MKRLIGALFVLGIFVIGCGEPGASSTKSGPSTSGGTAAAPSTPAPPPADTKGK